MTLDTGRLSVITRWPWESESDLIAPPASRTPLIVTVRPARWEMMLRPRGSSTVSPRSLAAPLATLSLKRSEGWLVFSAEAVGALRTGPAPGLLPHRHLDEGQPETVNLAGTVAVLSPF